MTGVILALLSIPLSVGYAWVAGLPPQYGLYGALFPTLVFCLISSSPRFVFGVDAAPAALVGNLLPALGIIGGSAEAVSMMPIITLLTALWLLLFWLLRGGRFAKYISEPVLGGCVTGIASIVLLTQLPSLFGGTMATGRAPTLIAHLIRELGDFHWPSFLLGAGTVAVILVGRRRSKISFSVIMMVLGILTSLIFHWEKYGVTMVGAIPPGLPVPVRFDFSYLLLHAEKVVLDTLAVALVIAAETLVSTLEVSRNYEDDIDNQREILAYGLANLVASIFGSSPISGSISRTNRAMQLEVRSQWMSISAFVCIGLFLLFGTSLLAYLPVPVLTGIVIASLITMMEFRLASRLWKLDRVEFLIFAAAFLAELIGLAEGVIVGVVLSFTSFTLRASAQPRSFLGIRAGEDGFHDLTHPPRPHPIAHTVLYQFNGPLFFASVEDFERDIRGALMDDTNLVVVTGVSSVDMFAAERLLKFYRRLKQEGIRLYLAGHADTVREQLINYGAKEMIREGAVRKRLTEALAAGGLLPPYPLSNLEKRTPAKK